MSETFPPEATGLGEAVATATGGCGGGGGVIVTDTTAEDEPEALVTVSVKLTVTGASTDGAMKLATAEVGLIRATWGTLLGFCSQLKLIWLTGVLRLPSSCTIPPEPMVVGLRARRPRARAAEAVEAVRQPNMWW